MAEACRGLAQAVVQVLAGVQGLRADPAEVRAVERQHAIAHVDCRRRRPGLGALQDVIAELAEPIRGLCGVGFVVEVHRALAHEAGEAPVAGDECAGAEGDVAQLVRIHRHRVGEAQRAESAVHRGRGKVAERLAQGAARHEPTAGVAEQATEVPAPRCIDVKREALAATRRLLAQLDQARDRIDGAEFGGAEPADHCQHRLARPPGLAQQARDTVGFEAHVRVDRGRPQLRIAQAQQLHGLGP